VISCLYLFFTEDINVICSGNQIQFLVEMLLSQILLGGQTKSGLWSCWVGSSSCARVSVQVIFLVCSTWKMCSCQKLVFIKWSPEYWFKYDKSGMV